MAEVRVLRREDDPEALVILASGVPSSPVKRPTFRIRNLITKAYVTPTGFQPAVYEFSWDVARVEDVLKFSGPFGAFKWLKPDDPLSLEIPAVGYSAKISIPLENEVLVESQASVTLLESEVASDVEQRPIEESAPIPSGRVYAKLSPWLIAMAILAIMAAVLAGWEYFQASEARDALARMQSAAEAEKSSRDAAAAQTLQALSVATSAKERLALSLAASEQKTSDVRKEMDDVRLQLKQEREANASVRDRLVSVQRDLEATRVAARNASTPAPITQVELPGQARPTPAPSAAPQPSPSPQASVWPQTPVVQSTLTPSTNTAPPKPAVVATDCDNLAANPNDQRRVAPGVKFPELALNAAAAIAACDRDLAANPGDLRLLYQKARALYAAKDARARPIFNQLMKAGYAAAFDNAAQYYVIEGRVKDAYPLLLAGVTLQDPDSMITLANAIRSGSILASFEGEDRLLYQLAAGLGHQGAQKELENLKR